MQRFASYIQQDPKRLARLLLAIVIFILCATWLVHYLTTGFLTITTNNKTNEVVIRRADNKQEVARSTGNFHGSMPGGEYVATVSDRFSAIKQVVHIKTRHGASYNLDVKPVIIPESVLPFGASGVIATNSSLTYIDPRDHLLYRIEGTNTSALINQAVEFNDIKWQNPGYGVGIGRDNKSLYAIRNDSVSPLQLPFNSDLLYYELAPNGTLVISDSKTVFRQARGESFTKIFTPEAPIDSLRVSSDAILLQLRGAQAPGSEDDDGESILLNQAGKVIKKAASLDAYDYRWSPDGKYLATTGDTGTTIYDARLNLVANLPDPNVLALTWLNKHTLLYGIARNLFSYDLQAGTSSQLAAINATGGGVVGVYPSQDQTEVYILSEVYGSKRGSTVYELLRAAPKRPASAYISELSIFLPLQLDQCYVDYINFSRPVLLLFTFDNSLTDGCLQTTKTSLIANHIDPSKLLFSVEAAPQEVD